MLEEQIDVVNTNVPRFRKNHAVRPTCVINVLADIFTDLLPRALCTLRINNLSCMYIISMDTDSHSRMKLTMLVSHNGPDQMTLLSQLPHLLKCRNDGIVIVIDLVLHVGECDFILFFRIIILKLIGN